MNNVTFQDFPQVDGTNKTYAIIDRGNGEFTSMLKSVYDEMVANQATLPTL